MTQPRRIAVDGCSRYTNMGLLKVVARLLLATDEARAHSCGLDVLNLNNFVLGIAVWGLHHHHVVYRFANHGA